jgi:exonuclease SbcD
MKILHTSDWHLGRTLYGRKRYDEFSAFLEWLADRIEQEEVDVLIVAGDIFDTNTPGNRAQALYYRFLHRVGASCCRHVVVVAGNHDSPSFLDAPKTLLELLSVHVVGAACEDPADEVLELHDRSGETELIVCAVPYLRDRDIRTAEAGESVEEKDRKLLEGIRDHYAAVACIAEERRKMLKREVPVVATGHLFAAGGRCVEGDGVRELYVGSLAHVGADIFPSTFDYVALGHLHVPQKVGGHAHIRYSGSPIPMGFGEAGQQKSLSLVCFSGKKPEVTLIDIPCFQKLVQIRGDWEGIAERVMEAVKSDDSVWLEILYEGEEIIDDLRGRLEALTEGTKAEILRIRNSRIVQRVLGEMEEGEALDDLDLQEVFMRCLERHEVPQSQRGALLEAYGQIVTALHESDAQAE